MRSIHRTEIVERTFRRTTVEMSLARDLKAFYEKGPPILRLRDFVAQAIEQVLVLAKRDEELVGDPRFPGLRARGRAGQLGTFAEKQAFFETEGRKERIARERNAIERLLLSEKALGVWRKRLPSIKALESVYHERNTWTPSECSDLIRLYATITEDKDTNVLRSSGFVGKDVAELQDGARVGSKEDVWGQPTKDMPNAPRSRHALGKAKGPVPVLPRHLEMGRLATLHQARHEKSPGIKRFLLQESSTIRKIDAVFGLPSGADISGTTADSIFFMKNVEGFFQVAGHGTTFGHILPAMQLLPLATMVSGAHHTLVESAIVLTMNANNPNDVYGTLGDYCIGFYSTLLASAPDDPEVSMLRSILKKWEAVAQDLHILCFWEKGTWKGYHYNTPREIGDFRKFARTGLGLLKKFRLFPAHVTRENLRKLARERGVPGLIPAN